MIHHARRGDNARGGLNHEVALDIAIHLKRPKD